MMVISGKLLARKLKVLGLMSGTSMDGLDCCLCEIYLSKDFNFNILSFKTYKYSKNIIKKISDNVGIDNITSIKSLDDYLGKIFRDIVEDFLKDKTIDLISSHGQTIIHQNAKRSIQIGNPKFMYDLFKIPVIHNFRQKDISMGGTGAPLVPYLDWLLFNKSDKNIVTVNIGGISNLTYIPSSGLKNDVIKCIENSKLLIRLLEDCDIKCMRNELSSTVVFERPLDHTFDNQQEHLAGAHLPHTRTG